MKLANSFRQKGRFEESMSEELRDHLDRQTEANIAAGMSAVEARRQARLQLGGLEGVKENCREERRGFWLETIWADVRYAVRVLRKNPGFASVAMITLALGIGANTAIFTVVNAVLLRPLPYRNAERLVWAAERFPFNHDSAVVLSPDFLVWKEGNDVFEQIGAFGGGEGANLTGANEPEHVSTIDVTTDFFELLGIRPLTGRTFLPEESKQVRSHVALLNEALWRSRFNADPQVVGKTINLDGVAYSVVGVMPDGIHYPKADVWRPLALDSDVFSAHSTRWMMLIVVGRLKASVSVDQARANLQVLIKQMDRLYPPEAARFRGDAHADVVPLHAILVEDVRSLLLILMGAVGLVLLIACANVANLLLSRAAARSKEIAVRATLGAGRWRLVRQMLTESLVLAAAGGLLGLIAGLAGTQLLKQLIPSNLPSSMGLEWKIFGFVAGLAILSVALFGLVPAIINSITDVGNALKSGPLGRQRKTNWLRDLLVVAEVSLSLALLAGAGLLVRSFLNLTDVHLGFESRRLALATVERPLTLGFDSPEHAAFFQKALVRIRAVPGVQSAAITRQYPLGELHDAAIQIRMADGTSYHPGTAILLDGISSDYFETMGIPLLKGRGFNSHDSADSQPVAILSDSLARQAFRGRDPLGQRFTQGPNTPERLVVGVVADIKNATLEQEPLPEIYLPYVQDPSFDMAFVVRSKGDPRSIIGGIRAAVLGLDKNQPLSELQTMDDLLASLIAPQQFRMLLVGLFAALALVLAAVGVYGLIAYSVSQRTQEIGIRMALGAQPKTVMKFIMSRGALLAFGGVVLGLVETVWMTRLFSNLLYGVKPNDAITFVSVSLALLGVSLLAAYIPARRAMRVDPLAALRHE